MMSFPDWQRPTDHDPLTTAGRGGGLSRSALLVGEVALSLTLLLGAGLLVRTLGNIRDVDLGFETASVERFRVSVPETRYDSLGVIAFLEEMEATLAEIPGVRSAGWGFGVPLASGSISTTINFLDRPELSPADRVSIDIRPSSVGFLDATGMTLQKGRWIAPSDRYGEPGVAVINEALATEYYPGGDPIGKTLKADISWGFEDTPPVTIVGIVKDVVKASPVAPPSPAIYLANAQFGANTGYVSLSLEAGVATAIPQARTAISDMDPALAIWNVTM
jgi:putative ABC transport system permease protein